MIINFLTDDIKRAIKALSGDTEQILEMAFGEVNYDASDKIITFKSIDGTQVGQIDTSDFVVDGMVESVSLSGSILTIEFNTESGKQNIDVDFTELFNPELYYTKTETNNLIADFVTSGDVETQILSKAYASSASVYAVEQTVSTALNELHTELSGISATVETKQDVISDLATIRSGAAAGATAVQPAALSAYTPTTDFATINGSAITEGGNIIIQGGGGGSTEEIELPIAAAVNEVRDSFNAKLSQKYLKKDEIINRIKNFVTEASVNNQIVDYVTPIVDAIYATIEDKELAISAALNDLNENTVKSSTVKNIWSGSQSEYDSIIEKDNNTIYVII